jgi:hypothetical protein
MLKLKTTLSRFFVILSFIIVIRFNSSSLSRSIVLLKNHRWYVIFIFLSVILIEVFIPTNWRAFGFTLFAALWNFIKLIAIVVIVKKLKSLLDKSWRKFWLRKLFGLSIVRWSIRFAIKFPIPIYSLYLLWYIVAAFLAYLSIDFGLAANILLQNTVAMSLGIIVAWVAIIKKREYNFSESRKVVFLLEKAYIMIKY